MVSESASGEILVASVRWKFKECLKGRMINVSVDVWDFAPVPIIEVEKIIQGQGGG